MTTAYSSLLGLALPVQGELAGQWGDTVNDYITKYLDASIAGSLSITADVTLTKTTGTTLGAASSQYAILTCSPSSVNIVVTAPAAYKIYVVNNTSASYTVTIRGDTPTSGVVLAALEKAVVAWNGSDFFKVATSATDGVSTFSAGSTGLTPSSATAGAVTLAGTLAVANGGTGLTAGTSGGVLAYTAAGTLASSAALAASALVIGGGAGVAPSTTTTGTGVVTALGVNTGSAGAFVVNGGALGTPSSGTVTNLTGTASININGTVGATTATTGAFTTLGTTGNAAFGTATAPVWSVTGVVTAGPYGVFYSETNASSVVTNAYYSGGIWNYRNTNPATRFDSYNGDHSFYTAPSGTAGAAVTFTERARITSTGLNSTVIGATTPAAGSFTTLSATDTVSVKKAAANTAFQALSVTNADPNSRTGASVYIGMYGAADTYESGRILSGHVTDYDAGDGFLAFYTRNSNSLAERVRINRTGTVILEGGLATAAGTGITFPATQNASSNANTLDDYDEYTAASAACTGAITTAAVWKLTKIGNVVTLTLPAVTGTASAANYFVFGTVLPAKYRPAATHRQILLIKDNNAPSSTPGYALIDVSVGDITVYKDVTGAVAFTAAQPAGMYSEQSVSWTI